MCRLRIWNPLSTPPAGASPATTADSPLRVTSLRGAQRLEGIGHGQRQSGECLSVDAGLSIGQQKADEDAIGGMLTSRLSESGIEIDGAGGDARLIQRAVESAGIGDEKAHVSAPEFPEAA